MNRLFFLLFFSCYACLKIYPYERLDFSSEKASYDGQNLFLEGAVTLSSDLGLMQAQEATLLKIDGSNETEFSALELKKQVFFDFHSGASLSCNQAQFDLISLTGTLRFLSFGVLGDHSVPLWCDNEACVLVAKDASAIKRLSYVTSSPAAFACFWSSKQMA